MAQLLYGSPPERIQSIVRMREISKYTKSRERCCVIGDAPVDSLQHITAHMVGFGGGVLADSGGHQHRLPPVVECPLNVGINIVADHDVVGGRAIESLHMLVDEFKGFVSGLPIVN